MQVIPAIDLLDGRVVRLAQGDYARQTVFAADPEILARQYATAGAEWLHVVDLNAADRDGSDNFATIEALCQTSALRIQTGGGVRTVADLERRFEAGAQRVVLGSLCVRESATVCRWLAQYGAHRIVAALDVRGSDDGRWWPQAAGWREAGDQDLWPLLTTLVDGGLRTLLCTDIARDGMLNGPNVTLYQAIRTRFPALELQASGGVGHAGHLQALADVKVSACIVGRALLQGTIACAEIGRWSR